MFLHTFFQQKNICHVNVVGICQRVEEELLIFYLLLCILLV